VNTNGQTTVTVYADYVPRGVGAMQFSMRFPYNAEVALAPADDAGIVSDWTLAPSGALLASPDADTDFTIDIPGTTNTYLKYGSFGPLFTLSFTVPGGAPAPHVNLTAVTMRNDIAGTNTFPVTYPRVLFIEPRADSYGPSLPTPRVKFIDPDTAGLKLDIANAPGQVATARFWNPGGGELMLKFPLSDPTTSLLGTSAAYVAVDGVVKADDTEFVAYLNDNSQAVDFDIVLNQTKLQPGQTTAQISIPYSYYISGGGGLTSSSRTGSITLQFLVR
jgi:hypothetical protein